jgi:hypothetical protein
MSEQKPDPSSDAARTDPKTADESRETLRKQAEKGLRGAREKPSKDVD